MPSTRFSTSSIAANLKGLCRNGRRAARSRQRRAVELGACFSIGASQSADGRHCDQSRHAVFSSR